MSDTKSFASLGPTLLARKGAAKPAMRPQLAPLGSGSSAAAAAANLEDLGWNDMGDDHAEQREAEILPLTPAETHFADDEEADEADVELTDPLAGVPEVRRQQEDLAERVTQPAPQAEAPAAKPEVAKKPARNTQRRRAVDQGRRAAFTLRLDQHRHTQLKLAATLLDRSAQQIVTEALDRFIEDTPEIEQLARQVERKRK
ncbi:hypothetical protein [Paraurantiacibacter namhicola]|uniref:Uncharacterized protein n=1 Tax=Paraurantiacibacter namhicola TaxID=645517 RepID=A0A1C7DB11_9SPHN|nr:hypothetical protein [Paraurantiacibacter namhicola]ANU08676.1 hypothetical protein A6F65_02394 [Paraurantiacibacter namhicola]